VRKIRYVYLNLVGKPKEKRLPEIHLFTWEEIIKLMSENIFGRCGLDSLGPA
jgi:hypothetical protein